VAGVVSALSSADMRFPLCVLTGPVAVPRASDGMRGAPLAQTSDQLVALAALTMTRVTAPGSASMDRWGAPSILVMRACARWAKASCAA
jgi:hypothetical protein